VLRIFIALKNPSPWPGFEPTTFGSNGQHTNHYTTKVTHCVVYWILINVSEVLTACIIRVTTLMMEAVRTSNADQYLRDYMA
jgi:hypothetical protein